MSTNRWDREMKQYWNSLTGVTYDDILNASEESKATARHLISGMIERADKNDIATIDLDLSGLHIADIAFVTKNERGELDAQLGWRPYAINTSFDTAYGEDADAAIGWFAGFLKRTTYKDYLLQVADTYISVSFYDRADTALSTPKQAFFWRAYNGDAIPTDQDSYGNSCTPGY